MRANFNFFHLIEAFKRYHECIELNGCISIHLRGFFFPDLFFVS